MSRATYNTIKTEFSSQNSEISTASTTLHTSSHAPTTTSTRNYYGYRYYSSDLARWLSRDPIVEPGFIVALSGGRGYLSDSAHEVIAFARLMSDLGYSSEKTASILLLLFSADELAVLSLTRPQLWSTVKFAQQEGSYLFVQNGPISRFDPLGDKPSKRERFKDWLKNWAYEMSKQICPGGMLADAAECVAPMKAIKMIRALEEQYQEAEDNGDTHKAQELLQKIEDLKSKLNMDPQCASKKCKCSKKAKKKK